MKQLSKFIFRIVCLQKNVFIITQLFYFHIIPLQMDLHNRVRKMKSGKEALSDLTDGRGDEEFSEIEVNLFLFKKAFLI